MSDKNPFGGKAGSLYVPLTDIEREVLERMVSSSALQVSVVGWQDGIQPKIRFGDMRFEIKFRINFDKPVVPQPLYYLDLELKTQSGFLVYKDRQATMYQGKPIEVAAGMYLDLVWDIAIEKLQPELIKMFKPKSTGLTSRRGNMQLSEEQQRLLEELDSRNKIVKDLNQESLDLAYKAQSKA